MSGCQNTERLSLCPHNIPVKFGSYIGCDKCKLEHDLCHIITRVEKLETTKKQIEHKIEHCYEGIEKCFDRIEKLESSKLSQELDPKVWVFVNERLDKLENMETENKYRNYSTYLDIIKRMEKLETTEQIEHKVERIADLEKRINNLSNRFNLYCEKSTKTPHKCPVCNGTKFSEVKKWNRITNEITEELGSCVACEGKGIIWG